jgi:hypothetical protein
VVGAAPASADPKPGNNPSPFATLSCDCPKTATAGSPAPRDKVAQGLQDGLSGSPAGAQPRQ